MTMRYGSVRDESVEGCYLDMLYIVSVLVLFRMGILKRHVALRGSHR